MRPVGVVVLDVLPQHRFEVAAASKGAENLVSWLRIRNRRADSASPMVMIKLRAAWVTQGSRDRVRAEQFLDHVRDVLRGERLADESGGVGRQITTEQVVWQASTDQDDRDVLRSGGSAADHRVARFAYAVPNLLPYAMRRRYAWIGSGSDGEWI